MNTLGNNLYEKLIQKGISIPNNGLSSSILCLTINDVKCIQELFDSTSVSELKEENIKTEKPLNLESKEITYTKETKEGFLKIDCIEYVGLEPPLIKKIEYTPKNPKGEYCIVEADKNYDRGFRIINAIIIDKQGMPIKYMYPSKKIDEANLKYYPEDKISSISSYLPLFKEDDSKTLPDELIPSGVGEQATISFSHFYRNVKDNNKDIRHSK